MDLLFLLFGEIRERVFGLQFLDFSLIKDQEELYHLRLLPFKLN